MGEVYRAVDTRLGRSVAIKVLPESLSSETDRIRRFEKEARAASSLNHPNIVTIYDIGKADARAYIAMEMVEGKTLRELLHTGPVPLRKLLSLAAQVADGLANAHEAGIVHRDLKPENLMVTRDGFAKILDFGLAKLTQAGEKDSAESALPTQTRGTEPGVVMGTVGYMSPEQASGRALDFRSDQFSFGSILYEMATGKPAFVRNTAPETLAAIIREEPEPLGAVATSTPVPLRWIAERCLAKEPQERYASTRDLARDLARLRDGVSEASGSSPSLARIAVLPRPIFRRWPVIAVLGLIAGVTIGVFAAHRPPEKPPVYHPVSARRGSVTNARFGPDGQTILYSERFDGKEARILSTRWDSPEWGPLPLPPASLVSVSDSGKLLIALQQGQTDTLAEVPLAGGAPREILELLQQGVPVADFAPGGDGLAVIRRGEDRDRLEFPAGKPLYDPGPGGRMAYPRVSPKGDRVAFFESATGATSSVAVVDRKGKKTTLSEDWGDTMGLAWNLKTDEIWFGARGAGASSGVVILHAVSMSGRHRVILGGPGLVIVRDISRDGRVLLEQSELPTTMMCLPPGATKEVDLSWFGFSEVADLSADGKTILFSERGGSEGFGGATYLRKTDGSPAVRLGDGYPGALSPDGKWAAAFSLRSMDRLLLWPTAAGQPKTLQAPGMLYDGATWLPDGKRILFSAHRPGHLMALFVQDLNGGSPRPVTPEGVESGVISSDGKLVAARGPGVKVFLYPIEGGQPREVSEIKPSDHLIRWDERGDALFLYSGNLPIRIERLELSSGRREFWKELAPADLTGVTGIAGVLLTPDGKSYAYTVYRTISYLFVVDGLK